MSAFSLQRQHSTNGSKQPSDQKQQQQQPPQQQRRPHQVVLQRKRAVDRRARRAVGDRREVLREVGGARERQEEPRRERGRQLERGARLHQRVAREAELLELAVELAAPAREEEAAEAAGAVLEDPVDRGGGLALRAAQLADAFWGALGVGWCGCYVCLCVCYVAGRRSKRTPEGPLPLYPLEKALRTEWRPATPSAPSRHLVVNTPIAPPKKYCTPRQPMYDAYCGATDSGKP